ncbi:MAG: phospholipid carrier-dependent glycosyltransferase, partial [Thermodesulfobacteriota bacterium]
MYSYHTHASKLHVYRSEWWTWPLLYRPICLYIEKIGSHREYIYSLGNPVIWWSGIIFIITAAIYSIKCRYYPLMFVVAGFLAFWLPWSVSPR